MAAMITAARNPCAVSPATAAGAAATAQPADAPVPEGADDGAEGSRASATLELPTDSLLPGEACVVTVPASRPERFVRAAWQSGEDTGTVVAKVR